MTRFETVRLRAAPVRDFTSDDRTASPEQSPIRSLRGVSHTFYTTQTNKPRVLRAHTGTLARLKLLQVSLGFPRPEAAIRGRKRHRYDTIVDVSWDLLLLLSLTGGASVAPKHGLHDGATALTLHFRTFSAPKRLFFPSTINRNVSSENLIVPDL